MTSNVVQPHLKDLLAEATEVTEAVRKLESLSTPQLFWKPAAKTWSIAQCLEHIRKTDAGYLRALDKAIRTAPPDRGAEFRPSWRGRLFISAVAPEPRLKIPSPRAIRPDEPLAPDGDIVARVLDQQAEVMALIRSADGADINRGHFPSPINPLLRISIGEGLTVIVRHAHRHVNQAHRVTSHSEFPRI